ncbi:OmpA family protein [Hydromonas duriensis]|uniref:OmpA family protein n=1 Tax=Hydromonas duriensis TaxID=1527608 RepID=A0A4R6Y6Z0_9BURK|nr:OmpA family protein [Hydromonas duriensis]TDR30278.1 OmpA family protein [Hydromonas duriensis]
MATTQKHVTGCLVIGLGLLSGVGQASDGMQPTPKTLVKGQGADAYFSYGVEQQATFKKPYVTCVNENACPVRTPKSLVVREKAPAVVPKAVEPIQADAVALQVHFAFAKSTLSPYEQKQLQTLVPTLKKQGSIRLRAYTDPVGGVNSTYNRRLALNRAMSVKQYLTKRGVNKAKFVIEYNPPCCLNAGVTANSSDAERQALRVVDISYFGK